MALTRSRECRSALCSMAVKIYCQKTILGSPSAVSCYLTLYNLSLKVNKLILTAVWFSAPPEDCLRASFLS